MGLSWRVGSGQVGLRGSSQVVWGYVGLGRVRSDGIESGWVSSGGVIWGSSQVAWDHFSSVRFRSAGVGCGWDQVGMGRGWSGRVV